MVVMEEIIQFQLKMVLILSDGITSILFQYLIIPIKIPEYLLVLVKTEERKAVEEDLVVMVEHQLRLAVLVEEGMEVMVEME